MTLFEGLPELDANKIRAVETVERICSLAGEAHAPRLLEILLEEAGEIMPRDDDRE
jgi:hypothetical protein